MTTYRYIPAIGSNVRMRQFSDYTSRDLTPWAHLKVEDVQLDLAGMEIGVQVMNGPTETGVRTNIPLDCIEAPIGWKERYEIFVAPDKVDEVIGWLKRGIAVRACHALESAGSMTYQPADNCGQPHWAYPELTDVVPPEQTLERIRIVKYERTYDAFVMRPCKYCIEGKRTPENNPAMESWQQNVRHCPRCNVVMGFSFDAPYHEMLTKYGNLSQDPVETLADMSESHPCPEVHPAGWCFVCHGTGMAAHYISECVSKGGKRSERAQAIAELESAGWKVHFDRHQQSWIQERETVVKDYGKDPVR